MADTDVQVAHEFVAGDTDTTRDYIVKRAGSVVNLTGYDPPVLYARNRTTHENLASITGSIVDAAAGQVRVNHDTMAAVAGEYLCDIELVHPSNGTETIRRSFKNIVRPGVHDLTD